MVAGSNPAAPTTDYMKKDKVVIIGGGLQGLATANALIDRGIDVLVLERNKDVANEASFANGGMLTPSHAIPWNHLDDIKSILSGIGRKDSPMVLDIKSIPSLFVWGLKFLANSSHKKFIRNAQHIYSLASYSKKLTVNIRRKEKFSYDNRSQGSLKIFRSEEHLNKTEKLSKKIFGSKKRNKILTSDELVTLEPALENIKSELVGGMYYREDEIGDAYKFCKLLEETIRLKGGRILTNNNIKKILLHKGKINCVVTDRAIINTNNLVVTAGSWSSSLLRLVGIKLPVKPVKGYSLTLDTYGVNHAPKLGLVDESIHTAIAPLGNRIRIAGTAEFSGFNTSIHEKRQQYLYRMLEMIYPKLYENIDKDLGKFWYGFRPMSPDGLPYIGPTSVPGVYVNTGHGHLGWTLAMGSAELFADLFLEQETEIAPEPYLIGR